MKDFIDSLRQQIGDRISSPIFGSFAISWLIWNHQYFVVVFSDVDMHYRLQLAKQLVYPTGEAFWTKAVLWPTASSLGYILAYPWVSQVLLTYWERRQTSLNNRRIAIQGKAVLTEEMRDALLLRVGRERSELRASIKQLEDELEVLRKSRSEDSAAKTVQSIADLNNKLAEQDAEIRRVNAQNDELKRRFAIEGGKDAQRKAAPDVESISIEDRDALLHIMAVAGNAPDGVVSVKQLVAASKFSNAIARAYVSKAVQLGYMRIVTGGNDPEVEVTPDGFDFFLSGQKKS